MLLYHPPLCPRVRESIKLQPRVFFQQLFSISRAPSGSVWCSSSSSSSNASVPAVYGFFFSLSSARHGVVSSGVCTDDTYKRGTKKDARSGACVTVVALYWRGEERGRRRFSGYTRVALGARDTKRLVYFLGSGEARYNQEKWRWLLLMHEPRVVDKALIRRTRGGDASDCYRGRVDFEGPGWGWGARG